MSAIISPSYVDGKFRKIMVGYFGRLGGIDGCAMTGRCAPSQPAGGKGGLEVVAAGVGLEVEHLAGEVEAFHQA